METSFDEGAIRFEGSVTSHRKKPIPGLVMQLEFFDSTGALLNILNQTIEEDAVGKRRRSRLLSGLRRGSPCRELSGGYVQRSGQAVKDLTSGTLSSLTVRCFSGRCRLAPVSDIMGSCIRGTQP